MSSIPAVLPFHPGMTLSVEEFLRRWEALPDLKNAELIDGIVYMASPVSLRHGRTDSAVHFWLNLYAASTPACFCGANQTWLMLESVPQPDAYLCMDPAAGGSSQPAGRFLRGAPELIVEVSLSSAATDWSQKAALYQRAGVQEYVIVDLDRTAVQWRVLKDGSYQPLAPAPDGTLRSTAFPGLWLDPAAILNADPAGIQATMAKALASPEHQRFLEQLRQFRK